MKRLLLIVLPLLLIVGCSSPEPINYEETLNERDGEFYTKDTNEPYSGPVFSLYDDGKNDGFMTFWYWNGQKKEEGTYKEGKKDGKWTTWYDNGQKEKEITFKNGKFIETIGSWWEDGSVFE